MFFLKEMKLFLGSNFIVGCNPLDFGKWDTKIEIWLYFIGKSVKIFFIFSNIYRCTLCISYFMDWDQLA